MYLYTGARRNAANNFVMCFLLEIPLRGFPFQTKSFDECRMPKNTNNMLQHIADILSWRCSACGAGRWCRTWARPSTDGGSTARLYLSLYIYIYVYIYIYIYLYLSISYTI